MIMNVKERELVKINSVLVIMVVNLRLVKNNVLSLKAKEPLAKEDVLVMKNVKV